MLTAHYFQHGVAERMNRTLRDKAKCMLSESGLPSMFWDEAILTAAYLYNRVIPSGCKLTPYQSWTGNAPVYKHLRVFGCKAYAVLPTVSRNDRKPGDKATNTNLPHGFSFVSCLYCNS